MKDGYTPHIECTRDIIIIQRRGDFTGRSLTAQTKSDGNFTRKQIYDIIYFYTRIIIAILLLKYCYPSAGGEEGRHALTDVIRRHRDSCRQDSEASPKCVIIEFQRWCARATV